MPCAKAVQENTMIIITEGRLCVSRERSSALARNLKGYRLRLKGVYKGVCGNNGACIHAGSWSQTMPAEFN